MTYDLNASSRCTTAMKSLRMSRQVNGQLRVGPVEKARVVVSDRYAVVDRHKAPVDDVADGLPVLLNDLSVHPDKVSLLDAVPDRGFLP